jgi:hypothetical protein
MSTEYTQVPPPDANPRTDSHQPRTPPGPAKSPSQPRDGRGRGLRRLGALVIALILAGLLAALLLGNPAPLGHFTTAEGQDRYVDGAGRLLPSR